MAFFLLAALPLAAGYFAAQCGGQVDPPGRKPASQPATLSATAAASRPAGQVVIQLHWQPQAQFAGFIVAKEKGFFRQAGLGDVKLVWSGGGDRPLGDLADGKTDFCTAWLSQAIENRGRGKDIVNVAQIMQKSAMMLVARKSSGIAMPHDMNGKNVGMWGGDFDLKPMSFFRKFGVQPKIIPQNTSIVPFLRGAVAVASAMYYNEYHKILEAGLTADELQVFMLADYGMDSPEDGLYCTGATAKGRPELCKAAVSAVMEGWRYALANEGQTLDIVMEYCRNAKAFTNRSHQRWMLRAMGQFITHRVGADSSAWGTLDRAEYEKVVTVLVEQKLIDKPVPYEDFYRAPAGPGGEPEKR
ncbi:MAG: ABC transporter substrate-binding protein [Planctomycetes bacterium]|nr:ABC transporter substrate-binding protein [Planctomycetota bacterium]